MCVCVCVCVCASFEDTKKLFFLLTTLDGNPYNKTQRRCTTQESSGSYPPQTQKPQGKAKQKSQTSNLSQRQSLQPAGERNSTTADAASTTSLPKKRQLMQLQLKQHKNAERKKRAKNRKRATLKAMLTQSGVLKDSAAEGKTDTYSLNNFLSSL